MKEKTIEKIYWVILIILGSSAIYTSVGLLNSISGGADIIIISGGLEISPRIFANQILLITLLDISVAALAVWTLRTARKLHSK